MTATLKLELTFIFL